MVQASDLKALEVGGDEHGLVPSQLSLLQSFDTKSEDFVIQAGMLHLKCIFFLCMYVCSSFCIYVCCR